MNYWRILFLSLFVVACSNSESNRSSEEPPSDGGEDVVGTNTEPEIVDMEGMIHIENGSVTIGSDDKIFKANERPAMKVKLDYDFFMDIHEVTCGEYASIAKKAKLKTFGKCENDSLPLTDITYYDAILFANAKSKLSDNDTAYTYSKAFYDGEGHCTNLEAFAFLAEAKAFRLPTEAEWVYAATRAWDINKSWNNSNSEYKLHPVCSKDADSAGFCDMAGNALEWVNDWMGAFRDTAVTNYAGAPDGGDMGERIVKGGSYSSSANELNPYSRGDVYTVTSSTRAEYVGFRLAFGSIPDALWMNDDGTSITSIVTPLVGSEAIKNLTRTYNVKLAFRNDVSGNISFLDYRNGTLSIKEITKGINAYHPEISPDGNWIAYCTGFEGVSGKSEIYVQSLENEPKQIKLKAESAAIPRWRVLENGDTVIIYVNDAGNNKEKATFKGTSTWQVKFMNGIFGTPQKLFDGAYHGGISEDRTLAVSGARILRARIAEKGSTVTDKAKDIVWYDSAQACNVSLSQDGSKRTAFLDFAGKPGKEFVGETYATHQRVFIADSNGKLIQSIKAPSDYTFDHTEWATNGERSIIVATLTNVNGAHTKIALVDPADNSITEIAEGDELWHPNLWIKKINSTDLDTTFNLNLDSAGVYYNNSDADNYAIQWRYKMEMLWQYKDTTNVIVLGSSRALFGVNPLLFDEPFFVLNLANMKNTKYGSKYIFHNYVIPHFKNLKYVFISMDIDRWYHDDNYNFFYSKYKNYPGYIYDANHNFWVGNVPQNLFDITFESLGQASYAKKLRPTRGFQKSRSKGWEQENVPIKRDSMWYTNNSTVYYKNYDLLIDIVKEAAEHNITVIGVEFPQSPAFKTTGSYAQFGLQRSQIPYLFEEINNISKTYPNFIFVDENKMGDHDYSEDMAQDAGHLSTEGAAKMSIRLDSLLRTLE